MSFGPLIGIVDEGTSSAQFIVFKAGTNEIVCFDELDVPTIYPQEGWAEQDALLILVIVYQCIANAVHKLENLGGSSENIVAIGVTNQRESTVLWDKRYGLPLYNAIMWFDKRTSSTVEKMLNKIPNRSRDKNYLKNQCGLPISTYFSALKIRWLIDNVPPVKKAIARGYCLFGTIDSWLIWNLTGGSDCGKHITDVTNASRTMLMNIVTRKWDPKLLKFFEIPQEILPEIRSSSEIYGTTKLKYLPDCPISGCLGNQQAAIVGLQGFRTGTAKCTYDNNCVLLYNTGNSIVKSKSGLLSTVAYQFGNKKPVYALEGRVEFAGAGIKWLIDNLDLINESTYEEVANSVTDCGDVYFVPACNRSNLDENARGIMVGLSENTKKGHIIRATLEAICFQVRDILEAMIKESNISLNKILIDGAVTNNKLLLQLFSNFIGKDLYVIKTHTKALGASIAAYRGICCNEKNLPPSSYTKYTPQLSRMQRKISYKKWKEAVQKSLS